MGVRTVLINFEIKGSSHFCHVHNLVVDSQNSAVAQRMGGVFGGMGGIVTSNHRSR